MVYSDERVYGGEFMVAGLWLQRVYCGVHFPKNLLSIVILTTARTNQRQQ